MIGWYVLIVRFRPSSRGIDADLGVLIDISNWYNPQLGDKHIMLSYNWGVQDVVRTAYEYIESRGIPVWMDIKGGVSGSHSYNHLPSHFMIFDFKLNFSNFLHLHDDDP